MYTNTTVYPNSYAQTASYTSLTFLFVRAKTCAEVWVKKVKEKTHPALHTVVIISILIVIGWCFGCGLAALQNAVLREDGENLPKLIVAVYFDALSLIFDRGNIWYILLLVLRLLLRGPVNSLNRKFLSASAYLYVFVFYCFFVVFTFI